MRLRWDRAGEFDKWIICLMEHLKSCGLPVIVWGNATESMWRPLFEINGVHIAGICDIVAREKSDIRVYHPSEIRDYFDHYNAVIIVPYPDRMTREIKEIGGCESIHYLDIALFGYHPTLFKKADIYWFEKNTQLVNEVQCLLEDDLSREVMENVLNYWICGDRSYVFNYSEKQNLQYLDTFDFSADEVFVNAGAYDGRYTILFQKKVGKYHSIYNIECDPFNFSLLERNMSGLKNCHNIPIGLWNRKEIIRFQADGNAGSRLDDKGTIKVDVDTIDNLFYDSPITFLKADIEGAEYKMLDGAVDTIKRHSPKLAICCYHQMEDIIKLPFMIKNINPSYRIIMRHYTDTITETVCYAY